MADGRIKLLWNKFRLMVIRLLSAPRRERKKDNLLQEPDCERLVRC